MEVSRYRIYKAIIAGGLGIAVAIAIGFNIPWIALAAVIVAVVFAFILERSNKEIVSDERMLHINEKAAYLTFITMIVLLAAASLGIALFHEQLPENIVFLGTMTGFFLCAVLLVHMCLFYYFSRKL